MPGGLLLGWLLLGCAGSIQTPLGEEPVRGGLWYADPVQYGADAPHLSVFALSNSPLPCEVEVADDPDTPEDEAASARLYADAQLTAAATREGAWLVVMGLFADEAGLDAGDYTLNPVVFAGTATGDVAAGRGWAFWWHVDEAQGSESHGLTGADLVTDATLEWLEGPARVDAEEASEGRVWLDGGPVVADGAVTRCADPALVNMVWGLVGASGIQPR